MNELQIRMLALINLGIAGISYALVVLALIAGVAWLPQPVWQLPAILIVGWFLNNGIGRLLIGSGE